MIMPGWCERCRTVRNVHVSNAALARMGQNKIATGICNRCRQKEEDERRRAAE